MGYKAGQECQHILVNREAPTPHLALRVFLGDEPVGMIQRHEDDDQAAQGIQREKPAALPVVISKEVYFDFAGHVFDIYL